MTRTSLDSITVPSSTPIGDLLFRSYSSVRGLAAKPSGPSSRGGSNSSSAPREESIPPRLGSPQGLTRVDSGELPLPSGGLPPSIAGPGNVRIRPWDGFSAPGNYGLITRPEPLAGSVIMSWLSGWGIFPGIMGAFLLLLVFPDGHLLSRRWVPLAMAVSLGASLLALGAAFAPGTVSIPYVRKPFGIPALSFLKEDSNPGWIGFIVAPIGGLAAIVIRFRRSKGDERRKLKLFAYAAGFLAVALGLLTFVSDPDTPAWALMVLAVPFAFIPVTTGIGILRHSLYDIDLVVSRALVYGALAAFITAVYVGVVVGIGAIIGVGAFAGSGGTRCCPGSPTAWPDPMRPRTSCPR